MNLAAPPFLLVIPVLTMFRLSVGKATSEKDGLPACKPLSGAELNEVHPFKLKLLVLQDKWGSGSL